MTAYLDTTSLVKLYTDEAGSDDVRKLLSSVAAVATSIVAYPEARAAFARGRREGWLTAKSFSEIKRSFEHDWQAISVRQLDSDLAHEAGALAERYALRGFDGVHLASFLDLWRRNPDVLFSSFDARLNRAARNAVRRRT